MRWTGTATFVATVTRFTTQQPDFLYVPCLKLRLTCPISVTRILRKRETRVTSTIIILALIAAFLGLRLYSALGKHGSDQEVMPRAEEQPRTAPLAAPLAPPAEAPRAPSSTAAAGMVYEPAAEIGIRAVLPLTAALTSAVSCMALRPPIA